MGHLQQVRVFQGCSVPQTNGAVPGDEGSWQAEDKGLESRQRLCDCLELGVMPWSVRWPSEPRFDRDTSGSVCSCSVFSPPIPYDTYTRHLYFPLPLKCRNTCSCVPILLSVLLPKLSSNRLSFILQLTILPAAIPLPAGTWPEAGISGSSWAKPVLGHKQNMTARLGLSTETHGCYISFF